ncbi:MAG TPA: SDR family oxidoreductase [Opitutaceae bacterium]|nr:SDR family oxidoreductase [Opitutaceae bacterium]
MTPVGEQTVAVITGASGGVGRATARLLGSRRARVGLIARGRRGLEAAKREIEAQGGQGLVLAADVSSPRQMEAAAAAVERRLGPIDLWINNAMVSMYSPFMRMRPEEFAHIVEVTFLGAVNGARAALRRMLPRDRGVIIQVGSALAFRSIPLQSAYCASKHAIQGFVESLRSELIHEESAVRVSVVNLPALNTTQFIWTRNRMGRACRPVGTIFEPEVAAEAILFAAEHQRRELMVGFSTVKATMGEKFIPGMLDRKLAHQAWEGSLLKRRLAPRRADNFWKPVNRDLGARGTFARLARRHSPELWLAEHRPLAAAAAMLSPVGRRHPLPSAKPITNPRRKG